MYKHWRGLFYPQTLAVKGWFAHYAEQLDTVEINNSFYRLPLPETFARWRDQAPPGFRYAVKANRYLTQAKNLKDCEEPLTRMMASVDALGTALGPVLYQLPPKFRIDRDRLAAFLDIVPDHVANVFEFRDPSWYCDAIFALLESHRASLCVHDMPGSASPRVAIGALAYVRFHGTAGNMSAAMRRRTWPHGPNGWRVSAVPAARSGPTSTTTSTGTRSRMRGCYALSLRDLPTSG